MPSRTLGKLDGRLLSEAIVLTAVPDAEKVSFYSRSHRHESSIPFGLEPSPAALRTQQQEQKPLLHH
jgi:hypothetical protein